ncbi:uncharacterized protein LOC129953468 isoform X1 [Eupeodes corollae]|uniref:uncharacterized protein LOC129953468 isoform X1 n=1 Tax=Eupeodes corollae TaxID=290404 RepID=UPI002491C61C|nr:uncharacterized protein LOC129953468 isoform X1 [Eupeodes corollae]
MKFKCNLQDLPPTENGFILPHHGIWKESRSTTKLRVVFDGSSKPVNSTSLNEELLPGPSLQNDLSSVILKWRKFLFVFTSDIEKMFRQIIVHPEETKFQRILWRPDTFSSLQLYELQTVTYGTTCAPYLSIKVLQQLANDEADNFPKGAEVLKNDIYVDDIISGADDISSAKTIQKQLKELLSSGGFNLRKWTSNCPELLSDLQPEDCEFSFNLDDSNSSVKALGLFWNPKYDYFFFKISLPMCNIFTKRTLLSDASKLFDPLGLLAPTTILAKIYFQQLWLEGIGWDDPLPHKLSSEWEQYRNNLSFLQTIKIPRWLGTISSSSIEIHGFSDASNNAYSAVLYCRTHRPNGQIFVNIITAKTKVAPIKQISLPRLELCGAVLLAKLFKKCISATQIETYNLESYFWTDSTIVLSWIHALPIRWKTFVANRVSEIQEIANVNQWFHVSSEDNPADCASRGVQPQDLENHELWWNGPRWLSCSKVDWPSQDASRFFTDLEQKTKIFACTNVIIQFSTNLLSRFSSLNRLLRVTSYILRLRPKRLRIFSGYLKAIEIQTSLKHLITLSQSLSFPNEIKSLTTKKEISFKSKILNLHPFVDKNNQLRVGGRLRFANIDDDSKYPLILSGSCNLSKLLVADAHLKTLHGGQQLIMSYIRTKYWITNLRNVAKAEFHACVTCTRFNKMRTTQLMGSLPKVRVNKSRAFRHSGVDYAGPFGLKLSKGRSTKTYKGFICIFICLVTKAIHIELFSDMTSEGFLAAFRRFTARRGGCSHLYSDNGTNFVGANKELIKMNRQFLQILSADVRAQMENEGTSWSFIPPASPHFGGLWEAGVKSFKSKPHLTPDHCAHSPMTLRT